MGRTRPDGQRHEAQWQPEQIDRAPPYVLIGTPSEIIDQLHRARERWGFTHFVTRQAEPTGRIIEAIRADRDEV